MVGRAPVQEPGELGDDRGLLILARDAIIVRAANGEIRFWNHGAEEMYGWSAGEVIGRVERDVLGRSPSLVEQALRSCQAWEGELTHVRKNGTEVIVASRQVL